MFVYALRCTIEISTEDDFQNYAVIALDADTALNNNPKIIFSQVIKLNFQ